MGNGRIITIAKIVIIIMIILLIILAGFACYKIVTIVKDDDEKQSSEIIGKSEAPQKENASVESYRERNQVVSGDDTDVVKEPTYLLDFEEIDTLSIPEYAGEPYYVINENRPFFTESDKENPVFERYSSLDKLGRCGVATANIGLELMPTEERGPIGHIKPSGWHTVKYPEIISDLYLYNRCHLIAYALTGENDNESNLITGTRYMNVSGMLPFETQIAKYIELTGNHVLYRVTPCFVGDELVARGVHIEALSIEDSGLGVSINVFVYNVQPGIKIDYLTGDSTAE